MQERAFWPQIKKHPFYNDKINLLVVELIMKKYRVYQVDAFTTERFKGNPAGVVPDAEGLSDDQMQGVARELNNSETAFIFPPSAADHDVWVRFFTPIREVPSCGHATVSAHYVLALESDTPSRSLVQKTGAGLLPVEVIRENGDYRIIMTQGAIEFGEPLLHKDRMEILKALGLLASDMNEDCPLQIVSTGHSKVLVGIKNRARLNSLNPNLAALTEISKSTGCNGYFVFTLDSHSPDILALGRMFAPAIGIPEDPVSGNANGPLGAYLAQHRLASPVGGVLSFTALQGEAMGRPGSVEVAVDLEGGGPKSVRVGGRAVVAFKTTIEF